VETNAAALEIIKRNEGLRLDAYEDVVGVWTIGYGDTGPDVKRGLRITEEEAERRLADRLAREFEPGVLAAIRPAPATGNQFSAMVSLAYNIGVRAFTSSTVVRMHKAGDYVAAAEAFNLWVKAGGRVYAGLVRRRQEEAALYLSADIDVPGEIRADAGEKIKTIQIIIGSEPDGEFGPQSRSALNVLLSAAGQSRIRKE
jgi:lysozyme